MSLQSLRKEIEELRNSIHYKYEPACMVFIMGKPDSPTEAEIEAFRGSHPHTQVIVLTRKDCSLVRIDNGLDL